MQRKQSDCLMFILTYMYVSHILISRGTVSIFPATGWLVHKHSPHASGAYMMSHNQCKVHTTFSDMTFSSCKAIVIIYTIDRLHTRLLKKNEKKLA